MTPEYPEHVLKTLLYSSSTSWSVGCFCTWKISCQLSRRAISQSRPNSGCPVPNITTSGSVTVCPLCSTFTSNMLRTGMISPVYVDNFVFERHRDVPFSLSDMKCASPRSETEVSMSISIMVSMPFNLTLTFSGMLDPLCRSFHLIHGVLLLLQGDLSNVSLLLATDCFKMTFAFTVMAITMFEVAHCWFVFTTTPVTLWVTVAYRTTLLCCSRWPPPIVTCLHGLASANVVVLWSPSCGCPQQVRNCHHSCWNVISGSLSHLSPLPEPSPRLLHRWAWILTDNNLIHGCQQLRKSWLALILVANLLYCVLSCLACIHQPHVATVPNCFIIETQYLKQH